MQLIKAAGECLMLTSEELSQFNTTADYRERDQRRTAGLNTAGCRQRQQKQRLSRTEALRVDLKLNRGRVSSQANQTRDARAGGMTQIYLVFILVSADAVYH